MTSEHEIITVAVEVVAPNRPARKYIEECGEFGLYRFRIAVVNRKPLRYHAAGIQVGLHQFIVFLGIQGRGAFDPRMYGICRNHIELFRRGEDIVPRIVVNHPRPAVVQHVVIFFSEVCGRDRRDFRFEFADGNALHIRIGDERSCGDSSAKTDNQCRSGVRMNQRRDMSHHPFQSHIERRGRSLGFSANEELPLTCTFRNQE